MPVAASIYQDFKGFAVAAEDVSFGEAESLEIDVVRGGIAVKVPLRRLSATVTLKGISQVSAVPFIAAAQNNTLAQIYGGVAVEDLLFGVQLIRRAVLVKATPSAIGVVLAGQLILDSLQLEYHSQVFV